MSNRPGSATVLSFVIGDLFPGVHLLRSSGLEVQLAVGTMKIKKFHILKTANEFGKGLLVLSLVLPSDSFLGSLFLSFDKFPDMIMVFNLWMRSMV